MKRLISVVMLGGALVACGGGGNSDDGDGDTDTSADADDSDGDTADGDGTDVDAPVPDAPPATDHFSFFVTSYQALIDLSGSQDGFGGDLRYGETGAGAGLRGADKICATIAERSMPGAGAKPWRAFLSASDDGAGNVVNAIDRIGDGPWYDRTGKVFAPTKADLMHTRPANGDATIKNDFPNEDGVANHAPNGSQVDNHDMLTGSTTTGTLYNATATCLDWTAATGNKTTEGKPRVGHSWPRMGGGGGNMDHWMSALTESGCKAGVNLIETGGPSQNGNTVGDGGGYGGFYCFSLTP